MSLDILQRRWGNKPPLGTRLNRSHPLSRGLVAFYPFNENGSANVYDIVGTGPTLVPTSGPTWFAGPLGPAMFFIGGSYIDGGDPANMALGTRDFTFAAWIKVDGGSTANSGAVISRSTVAAVTRLASLEIRSDGLLQFELYDGTNNPFILGPTLIDAKWHHVVGVRKFGGLLYLYLDGVLNGSTSDTSNSLDTGTQAWRFGQSAYNGANLSAKIGMASIWIDRALNASEVLRLYTDPYGLFQPQSSSLVWANAPIVINTDPPFTINQPLRHRWPDIITI